MFEKKFKPGTIIEKISMPMYKCKVLNNTSKHLYSLVHLRSEYYYNESTDYIDESFRLTLNNLLEQL
jgi:hypothetical protein